MEARYPAKPEIQLLPDQFQEKKKKNEYMPIPALNDVERLEGILLRRMIHARLQVYNHSRCPVGIWTRGNSQRQ